MNIRAVGLTALLVEVRNVDDAMSLAAWARSVPVDAEEIVPAATSVLFDGLSDVAALRELLEQWRRLPSAPSTRAAEPVEIPVVYDGVDLEFVADLWGMDNDAAVARHLATEFTVAFCGFAPGFSYLRGLSAELAVPRLDSPRARVPAGSVALAGTWAGVYPSASPGGWRILGRTEVVLWDQHRPHPALLPPGTPVRFVRA